MNLDEAQEIKPSAKSFEPSKSELFIGLVGPCGTDLKAASDHIGSSLLNSFGYKAHYIKLSELLLKAKACAAVVPVGASEFQRIEKLMNAGDDLRTRLRDGSAVARLAVNHVSAVRKSISGDAAIPAFGNAFIFDSLKHPDEIDFFRNIYGQSFWVISVYEPYKDRIEYLVKKNRKTAKTKIPLLTTAKEVEEMQAQAANLLEVDKGLPQKKFGQNVGKAFHLADVFISKRNEERTGFNLEEQIDRFLGVLFGAPFVTPTKDEFGSFYAQAAALRSADLSRQVGAVITTAEGELISSGCNEVPLAGGGPFGKVRLTPKRKITETLRWA